MRNAITLLLIVALLAPAVASQQKASTAQRKAEEAQRRTQAIDILKRVVESAADIADTETRVNVLTGALDLLWKHDQPYARTAFIKSVTTLSDRFALSATDKKERAELRASIGALLRSFARHDPQAAAQQLDRFQKLIEDVLKEKSPSSRERLSLAEASLDSDPVQSAALAAKALDNGVPGSFPAYLNDLERRDAAAAASLFRVALSKLADPRLSAPVQLNTLSTYVFRESEMTVPVLGFGSATPALEFATFASPLSPPTRDLNQEFVTAYMVASAGYLTANASALEQSDPPDAIHVGFSFFLVKKLRGYVDKLGLNGSQNWAVLDTKYTLLAERAKLSDRVQSGLASTAQRIVSENTVFRFDGGEASFNAAEKTADAEKRAQLLAYGIRQQIEDGKFAEAVQKLADLRDDKLREQLNIYLSFRMAHVSLKTLDWDSFNAQVNRVSDARLRTYLILSAAVAANDAGNKKMSSEFLLTAMASLMKIDDVDARAAALIATAGMLYASADATTGAQVLTDSVNAINRTAHYDGAAYGVMLEAAKSNLWFSLPKFDLSHCFEQAAKRDWTGALAAAQTIESKALRAQAYIAACRNVL
ncbi:MAG TPA: hypothetical protein VFZ22_15715 [Pyrinomonadaceae bacterium]|nr:hypothetical protein [Pyrinomonadaceae bacterium]